MKQKKVSKSKILLKELDSSSQVEEEISQLINKMKNLKVADDKQIAALRNNSVPQQDKISILESIQKALDDASNEDQDKEYEVTAQNLMKIAERQPALMEALEKSPKETTKMFNDLYFRYILSQISEKDMPLLLKTNFGIKTQAYKDYITEAERELDSKMKKELRKSRWIHTAVTGSISALALLTISPLIAGAIVGSIFAVIGASIFLYNRSQIIKDTKVAKNNAGTYKKTRRVLEKGLRCLISYHDIDKFSMDNRLFIKDYYNISLTSLAEVRMNEDCSLKLVEVSQDDMQKLKISGWIR